jgi:hypothetical protein
MTQQELQQLKKGDIIRIRCSRGVNAGRTVRAQFVELKYPTWDKKKMHHHFMNIDWGYGSIFVCSENDLLSSDYIKS